MGAGDTIFGTLTRSDELARVLIIQRADGLATYRLQSSNPESGWGPQGPDAGLYDTVQMAEAEARARVWWLAA
jgi:hypothetical protein